MQATIQYIRRELSSSHSEEEIRELVKQIFRAIRGYTLTDLYLRQEENLDPGERQRVQEMVLRLKNLEPVQYVLGSTAFYGLSLQVNPHVLIPRPETEELVHWIITEQLASPCSVYDLCTGSGCIALAIKKAFPMAKVSGIDLSPGALQTARQNAVFNQLEVTFENRNVLSWETYTGWSHADLIISNPPYVTEGEKKLMKRNVLDFEPHLALFVPDEDPLLFYRRIAVFARLWLKPEGRLYFEINEQFGNAVASLLEELEFSAIEIRRDLQGKERMVRAIQKSVTIEQGLFISP